MSERFERIASRVASRMQEDEAIRINEFAIQDLDSQSKWYENIEETLEGVTELIEEVQGKYKKIQKDSPEYGNDAKRVLAEMAKVFQGLDQTYRGLGVSTKAWIAMLEATGKIT